MNIFVQMTEEEYAEYVAWKKSTMPEPKPEPYYNSPVDRVRAKLHNSMWSDFKKLIPAGQLNVIRERYPHPSDVAGQHDSDLIKLRLCSATTLKHVRDAFLSLYDVRVFGDNPQFRH